MGDLLGSPRVAPLFQYLFFTRPSGRRPSSRKLGSGGSGIRKGGAPWRGDGPREASRRWRRCLGGTLMMIVCAYIGRCDHTSTNAPDPIRTPQLSVLGREYYYDGTSFLPVLPAADPRPGSSAPAGRESESAGLNGEEMGPVRPLGDGAVALGAALMMIVCAYIGAIMPALMHGIPSELRR
ncbi:hypothetical protein PIB30_100967 [Stylosanthes scabra]|uniref:Uncharacterized protein n=1 Tax=Stylosanthes scabra TaxID=79078 RepID=A0ABU6YZ69_9FABA|nr:hypothetical protein [Stylosanthes scabra]